MFYQATVKEKIEKDNGKIQKTTAKYLVDAESITEVEAVIAKEYFGVAFDYELISVTETKIVKVLNGPDRAD